jgi:phosphoribosylformylglycinamidine cyclo-ligase
VPVDDMRRTFNMGIGMIVVVSPDEADAVVDALMAGGGAGTRVIGEVVRGDGSVRYGR